MIMASTTKTAGNGVDIDASSRIVGMSTIVTQIYNNISIKPLWSALIERVQINPDDAAALFDMATILQTLGSAGEAQALLKHALSLRQSYCSTHGDGQDIRLLAFVTAGDFMTNTPLDFLLVGSNCVLWLYYVDTATSSLADLPDYDVAFMAIGESDDTKPVLKRMQKLLAVFPKPVMNCDAAFVAGLTRDGVSAMLADEPSLVSPFTLRLPHQALVEIAAGIRPLTEYAPDLSFPLVVRPVGTHAGKGMERVLDRSELAAWLKTESAPELYVAQFIDFRSTDGLYKKQRIVFINGVAFASHMALSEHWIVHYLSAGMAQNPEKRAIEQAWMENFDGDFAVRHKPAFEALRRRIGLDYFGIDSAELPDGRLLIFELDVAMAVHNMDDPQVFPYKRIAMRKLFDAFVETVRKKADDTQVTCE